MTRRAAERLMEYGRRLVASTYVAPRTASKETSLRAGQEGEKRGKSGPCTSMVQA